VRNFINFNGLFVCRISGEIVRSNFEEFGDKWPHRTFEGYPKWTKEDDKNLLRGAYKHGLSGRFEKIRKDPELGFANKTLADYEDPNEGFFL
jgi:hypothetical protein